MDRLVMVSAGPPILHFYEPLSGTEQQVPLAADPTCVGLSPDGNFAAVGHASFISYVDLNAGTVLQTYPVSEPVRNLVVADNGYIYAQWSTASLPPSQQMSVVNIATGVETIVSNGGTQARQRPGLETLYVNDLHTNPEGRFDLDITGGGASPLHTTPYFTTHPFCGNLWFSEDGQRLFTACGDTFRASSSRDQDMTFTGSLSNATNVQSLVHAAPVHHAIVIPKPPFQGSPLTDTNLQIYHDAALEYRGTMPLPSFIQGGQPFPAHGRFVFFDESESTVVVVQQADSTAGLQRDFAVFAFGFDPSAFTGASGPQPPPVIAQPFPTFGAPIEDAKYDTALDRIVFVSSDPNLLHIFDPETGDDQQVSLPFAPNSVALAPAGDRAAVGHDGGHISLVDLTSATLVTTYVVSGDVLDLVLTPEWIYAGPNILIGIQLATGALEKDVAYNPGGDARLVLDASGENVYWAWRYEDGDLLQKINISVHPPVIVLGNEPSPVCNAVWLGRDGTRLFSRCGDVYVSSTDISKDLAREGRLTGISPVRHLNDSPLAGLIAAIPGIPNYSAFGFELIVGTGWNGDVTADERVALFNSATLSFQSDLPLTPFSQGSSSAAARGRFVFFNNLGTQIYVIVEADSASGFVNGFGIQSFDTP